MEKEFPKLKIFRTGGLSYDGFSVPTDTVNYADFMIAALDSHVELDKGMLISELVHALYPLKDFVKNYNAEDYEAIRSVISKGEFKEGVDKICIYNTLAIEGDYFESIAQAEVVVSNNGCKKISDIPVFIVEDVEFEYGEKTIKTKRRVTLFDVLTAVFEDFSDKMSETSASL